MSLHLVKKRRLTNTSTFGELCALLKCDAFIVEKIAENPGVHYRYLAVRKADKTWREIRPPDCFLKDIQSRLLRHFYKHLLLPAHLHGGLPKRSIVTHAARHVGQCMVATFDIRDFYPSTTSGHIEPVLFDAGFRAEALSIVISLVLLNNALPQGAPTSGLLANLAFIPADRRMMRLCRRHKLRYTRFVDDLAISGATDLRKWHGAINQIVSSCGYQLAKEKSRFFPRCERQIVTGLVVNDKLRPTKEFSRELKRKIHFCLEFGPESFASIEGLSVHRLWQQLNGQVSHVRHVDRGMGERLRRMLNGIKWTSERLATAGHGQLAQAI